MTPALVLATAIISQCPIYVTAPVVEYRYPIVSPVFVSTIPTTIPVVPASPVIREKVYFSDVVRTRIYADAKLPTGAYITVPVINGYVLRVTLSQQSDGSTLREYFYDDLILYKGGVVNYENQIANRSLPPPKRITMPSPEQPNCQANIERLEKMILDLQREKIQAVPPMPAPVKTTEQASESLYMKRPSEFDR